MIPWLAENYIELAGVVLSLLYLVLSIRQNIFLWPVGLLSAFMYVIVFFESKFYADMGLNVYYFFISIYGWVNWSRKPAGESKELPVTSMGSRGWGIVILLIIVLFFLLGFILDRFTDSPIPYWDAFTTAGSIVATYLLTRKVIGHWIIWIVVDLVSMGLYIYRGLLPTAVLFLVYTGMAVIGYRQWRKSMVLRSSGVGHA